VAHPKIALSAIFRMGLSSGPILCRHPEPGAARRRIWRAQSIREPASLRARFFGTFRPSE
jgi:hypothetical protein